MSSDDAGQEQSPRGTPSRGSADGGPAASGMSRRMRRGFQATAVVVLLVGAVALGTVLPNPTQSDAYRALVGEKTTVERQRDTALSDYASLKGEYDALEGGIATRESEIEAREGELGTAKAAVKRAQAAVKAREVAVTAAERTKAANTIGDGTWTVGTDIRPGTYRAVDVVGSSCYWGIYRSGSNGGDIIENDIPGGGRPVVTLSVGQDFNSARCGQWEKQ